MHTIMITIDQMTETEEQTDTIAYIKKDQIYWLRYEDR